MLLKSLISSLIFLFVCPVLAVTSSPSLREAGSRFLVRSLGSACYSMDSLRQGLPCNPAFIAKEKSPRFEMGLLLGSNLDYVQDAESLLDGRADEGTVARLFSYRDSIEAEVSLEASYQRPTWGISVEPYRMIYLSQFYNSALPMIDLLAAEEQNLRLQIASFTSGGFYAGLQLRYTHVRYLGNYFSIVDAFVEKREELLARQTQDLFYAEPAFLYVWEDSSWEPQVSAMLSHWGVSSTEESDQYAIQPQGLFGASVKPSIGLGTLEIGIQFQAHNKMQNLRDSIRGALAYQLGVLQAVVSASREEHTASFLASYRSFVTGLSYWSQSSGRTVFVQFGILL